MGQDVNFRADVELYREDGQYGPDKVLARGERTFHHEADGKFSHGQKKALGWILIDETLDAACAPDRPMNLQSHFAAGFDVQVEEEDWISDYGFDEGHGDPGHRPHPNLSMRCGDRHTEVVDVHVKERGKIGGTAKFRFQFQVITECLAPAGQTAHHEAHQPASESGHPPSAATA